MSADNLCAICGQLVLPGTGGLSVGFLPALHTACIRKIGEEERAKGRPAVVVVAPPKGRN